MPPPDVLGGDPVLIRWMIDSLPFKHRYTSGVLSFAPGEIITPAMEKAIMDGFERVAFAGLQPDQYSILWVRHQHAGHHELHFVTPRVELVTGKSLNIAPPGRRTMFDVFRSMINARYGLADPEDVRRARDVSLPNHIARLKADGARKGKALQQDIRKAITERVKQEVAAGRISDQDGVVRFLKGEGFTLNRQGKDYISVIEPSGSTKIRLKGVLYSQAPFDAVRANLGQIEPIYDAPDPVKASVLADQLEGMVAARAEYHRNRYGTRPEQGGQPQESESLREYLRRNLGADALRPRRWQGYGYEPVLER
ncbi:MAG TPA: relaxase/mobilization nuclease domain-containing protein [Gammaproteobacteria bacterium]|nr:relaxase/mobilization nuclease domain-containing protein [Gammaproteobacteria bacterium]